MELQRRRGAEKSRGFPLRLWSSAGVSASYREEEKEGRLPQVGNAGSTQVQFPNTARSAAMLKNNLAVRPPEVSTAVLQMPVETRGSRRELVKRQRRMQRIEGKTLVIGIDLARERQALTFGSGGELTGGERVRMGPPDPGAAVPPHPPHMF